MNNHLERIDSNHISKSTWIIQKEKETEEGHKEINWDRNRLTVLNHIWDDDDADDE